MTPLFLPEVDPHAFFEKQASIAKMPDDDTKWPAHVLSNLHQQLPFLSQYEVDLSLQRVEPEAGFAFGHALLMAKNDPAAATESKNPQNMIKIPVIIADRQLQPFHTFELSGNVYPLTSERIEAALLNPAVFEGPARQPHRQKSLIDQMYPPYQQRQGFGRTVGAGTSSMGVTKLSSASRESLEADLGEMSGHLGAVDYKNQSRKAAKRKLQARIEDLEQPRSRSHAERTMNQAKAGFAVGGLAGGLLGFNRKMGPVKGGAIGGGIGAGLGALEAQRESSKKRHAKSEERKRGFYGRTRDAKYRDKLIQRSLDGAGKRASAPNPRPRGSNARDTTKRRANVAHMIGTGIGLGAGLGYAPGALRAMKAEGVLRSSKKFKRLADQAAAAKAGARKALSSTQRQYLSGRAKELGDTAKDMLRDASATHRSDAKKSALKGALVGGAATSAVGLPSVYFQEKGAQADAFTMDPERLRTIAKLRSRETEDRYQTQKGLGGRMKSNLKNLALPVGAGLAAAGIRGGLAAQKGGLKAMKAGAKKGMKEGLLTSGAISAANIGLKERGLAKRQQQRAEIGMPRVGTLEDPKAVKAASAFKNPYVAMGTLGAGAMGTRSLMKNKNQMIQDMRDRRSGKIDSAELKRRMKEYAGSAAIDAAVGGGLGVGGTAAVKKLAVPQIKHVADEAGGFMDRKVRDAAREAMKEVDKSMDDKVYKINAAMAQQVDDIDRRVEKQIRNAVPNMAGGARDAAAEQARQAKEGIGSRLKNMFRSREDKWRDIADAPPTAPAS